MISKDINELWVNLKKKDFKTMFSLVESNPEELLNAIHPDHKQSLFSIAMMVRKKDESAEKLVNFIIKNEKFDSNNGLDNNLRVTNIDSIITHAHVPFTEHLKKDPRVVFNGKNLTYVSIKNYLEKSTKSYNEECSLDQYSEDAVFYKSLITRLEKMLEILREATILRAIKEDDADLLKQLEAAGGSTIDSILDMENKRQLPVCLLTKENIKVKQFHKEGSEIIKKELKEGLKERIKLTEEYHQKQNKLLNDAVNKKTEKIDKVISIFNDIKKNESTLTKESTLKLNSLFKNDKKNVDTNHNVKGNTNTF